MTQEDKIEIKSFIHDAMAGYHAKVDAQNTVTNIKLEAIDAHLAKQNGRIGKAEEAIAQALLERGANRQKQEDYFKEIDDLDKRVTVVEEKSLLHTTMCPNIPAIRALQDEALSNKSVKKFMAYMFTSGVLLGGLIVAILKLIIG